MQKKIPKKRDMTVSAVSPVIWQYTGAIFVKYVHCAVHKGAAHKPTMIEVITIVAHTAYPLAAIHSM
jgi:hypothetical protein